MVLKIGSLLKDLRKSAASGEGLIKNPISKSISKATGIHQSFGGIKGVNEARAAMNQVRSAVTKPPVVNKPNLLNTDSLKNIKDNKWAQSVLKEKGQGVYDPKTNTLINTGNDITIGGSREPEKEVAALTDHEQEKAKKPGRLRDALREVVYGLSLLPGPLQGIGAKIVDARKKKKEELEDDAVTKAKNEVSKSSYSEPVDGKNSKIISKTETRQNIKINQSKKQRLNKQQKRKLNIKEKKKPNIRIMT